MSDLKKLSLKFIILYHIFSYISYASEVCDNETPMPNSEISKPVINISIQDYLSHNNVAKLLLPCGHVPNSSEYYKHVGDYHRHHGWYTVDINTELQPDLIANHDSEETLNYIFPSNTWDVIYIENMSIGFLTHDNFKKIYHSLKPNGQLVFDPFLHKMKCMNIVDVNDVDNNQNFTLKILSEVFLTIQTIPFTKENFSNLESRPTYRSIFDAENSLKVFFEHVIGFQNITLYSDSMFDIESCIEFNNKIKMKNNEFQMKIDQLSQNLDFEGIKYLHNYYIKKLTRFQFELFNNYLKDLILYDPEKQQYTKQFPTNYTDHLNKIFQLDLGLTLSNRLFAITRKMPLLLT